MLPIVAMKALVLVPYVLVGAIAYENHKGVALFTFFAFATQMIGFVFATAFKGLVRKIFCVFDYHLLFRIVSSCIL